MEINKKIFKINLKNVMNEIRNKNPDELNENTEQERRLLALEEIAREDYSCQRIFYKVKQEYNSIIKGRDYKI